MKIKIINKRRTPVTVCANGKYWHEEHEAPQYTDEWITLGPHMDILIEDIRIRDDDNLQVNPLVLE